MKRILLCLGLAVLGLAAPLALAQTGSTPTFQVKTIADLVATTLPSVTNRLTALVTGRVTANDGGGGTFYYQIGTFASTNLGTVFKPASVNGRWLRDYTGDLNVLWFGAVNNAAVDSTTAITNALQVASINGGSVFFPSGFYGTTGFVIPADNMTLKGQPSAYQYDSLTANLSTLVALGAGTMIDIGNHANIRISDLSVNGNSLAGTGLIINLNTVLDRVNATACLVQGILGRDINSAVLNNVSCVENLGSGMVVTNTGSSTKYSIHSSNFRVNRDYGLQILEGDTVLCAASTFESNYKNGVYILKPTGGTISNLKFSQCWWENNGTNTVVDETGYQLLIDSGTRDFTTGPPTYLTFDGCRFQNTSAGQRSVQLHSLLIGEFKDCFFLGNVPANNIQLDTWASKVAFINRSGGPTALLGGNSCWDITFGTGGDLIYRNTSTIASQNLISASNYVYQALIGGQTGDVEWQTLSGFPNPGDYTLRQAGVKNVMTVKKTTGNVGFGTTNAGSPFVISKLGALGIETDPGIAAYGHANANYILSYDRAASQYGPLVFDVGGGAVPSLTLHSNGFTGILTAFPVEALDVKGNLQLNTAGNGFKIKEGANARMGTAVLNGASPSSVVVSNTSVTANTRIFLTGQVDGGTVGFVRVSARTASTSFTITSSANGDTSTVAWLLIEPSP